MHIYDITKDSGYKYDPLTPPGLCGAIIKDINPQAKRPQPRLSALAALQIVSCASAPAMKTPSGAKTNLYTIGIAPSCSGKEVGQAYIKEALGNLKIMVSPKPPSDKSVNRTLLAGDGRAVYLIDEVQSFFAAMDPANKAPAYLAGIGETFLQLYTQQRRSFDILELREAEQEVKDEKRSIDKDAKAEGIASGSSEYNRRMAEAEKKLQVMQQGIENPFVALAGYSTPLEMKKVFSVRNFESGQAGRFLVVCGDDDRGMMEFIDNAPEKVVVSATIMGALNRIHASPVVGCIQYADQAAKDAAKEIHYRIEEMRNDPELGAVMARAMEMISRVFSVIAVGDGGKVKCEHVWWATHFVIESVIDAWSAYVGNTLEVDVGVEARWQELLNKIAYMAKNSTLDAPLYKSKIIEAVFRAKKSKLNTIVNNAYPMDKPGGKKYIVDMALMEMLKAGAINIEGANKVSKMNLSTIDSIQVPAQFHELFKYAFGGR